MQLINIANKERTLFLFLRNDKGEQIIKEVNDFYPYYYEIHPDGNHLSYFGDKLKLLIAGNPSDVAKRRSANAFEADVHYTKKYLIDKVEKLEKCPIKYSFIDIETLSSDFPNVQRADKPISCISAYNSLYDNVQTFYLGNYKSEYELIRDFIIYMRKERFDLILGWNLINFDYAYLYNRVERVKDVFVDMGLIKNRKYEDFATLISPIGISRYGGEIKYPAGISVVDYLEWDRKITLNRRKSYKLDEVMHEELNKPFRGKVDFSKLSLELKKKNIEDVMWLAEFEKKNKYIDYFNEIRMLTKVSFEDMDYNSRMLDMLLLQEAHNQKIVLPMKPSEDRGTLEEKPDYKGAFREVFQKGCHYNSGVYDLSSAYPAMIIDFCLDPANLTDNEKKGLSIQVKHLIKDENDEHYLKFGGKFKFELAQKIYFKQNSNALLPKVVKKLIDLKTKIGKQLDETSIDAPNYKRIKIFYKAIKSLANTSYGVFALRYFRLFCKEVALVTTFLVRDLLTYVIEKLEEQGYKVIHSDTDGIMLENNTKDISDELNKLAKQWAKERYNKDNITTEFSYEGCFEKLFILAMCRHRGWLRTPKGELEEIEKGIEAKRKNSTIFIQKFQRELIDNKLLAKEPKEKIIKWIKDEIKNFPNQSLEDIAFPCKVAKAPEDYRNRPIFIRALESTNNFDVRVGDNFYYIYVKPQGYEMKTVTQELIQTYNKKGEEKGFKNLTNKRMENAILKAGLNSGVLDYDNESTILSELKKKGLYKSRKIEIKDKAKDVMAFSKENKSHIKDNMIDWNKMKQRNIFYKLETIFRALDWNMEEVINE